MTPQIYDWVKKVRGEFIVEPGCVLEIGSYDVNGSIRNIFDFDASFYVGIDMETGPGVDQLANSHYIDKEFTKNQFDTVICCEVFEHDNQPFMTVNSVNHVLKSGGFLIVTTPANGFPEHRYPSDYWRFMPDTFKEIIFNGFEILRLEEITNFDGSRTTCCIGKKV